jgi:hypothetical protein
VLRARRLAGLVAIAYVWLDAYCHVCLYYVTCSAGLSAVRKSAEHVMKRTVTHTAQCGI